MSKLLLFPNRKREATREEFQRRWLQSHDVIVVQKWAFPERTWLQRRLAKVRADRQKNNP